MSLSFAGLGAQARESEIERNVTVCFVCVDISIFHCNITSTSLYPHPEQVPPPPKKKKKGGGMGGGEKGAFDSWDDLCMRCLIVILSIHDLCFAYAVERAFNIKNLSVSLDF